MARTTKVIQEEQICFDIQEVVEEPVVRKRNPPGIINENYKPQIEHEEEKPSRSRRGAVGEVKSYSGNEWPRGGHVKLLEGELENCGAKVKKKFVAGGAVWVDTAMCVYCVDRLAGNCISWIEFREHIKNTVGVDEKGRIG